jgi:hypothetical protein
MDKGGKYIAESTMIQASLYLLSCRARDTHKIHYVGKCQKALNVAVRNRNESSGCTKCGKHLSQLKDHQFFKGDLTTWTYFFIRYVLLFTYLFTRHIIYIKALAFILQPFIVNKTFSTSFINIFEI